MNNISFQSVTFAYKTSNILKDCTCVFKENDINIILGLNGCGKSTIIKLLVGLVRCQSGSILLDNKPLNRYSYLQRSKILSYVPQLSSLYNNDFVVQDYLLFNSANTVKFYSQPDKLKVEEVRKIANVLGIDHLLMKKMNALSGGEKQLILIAGALVQNSPIIVLDEPTSALDLMNQYKVLSVLKKISCDKTIIMSSHNPNQALFLNAEVFLIKDGRCLCSGQAKDIVVPDILKNVYGDNISLSKEMDYNEITFK